jgi:hypothetical protein
MPNNKKYVIYEDFNELKDRILKFLDNEWPHADKRIVKIESKQAIIIIIMSAVLTCLFAAIALALMGTVNL